MKTIPFFILIVNLPLVGCGKSEDDVRRIVREEISGNVGRSAVRVGEVVGPYSPAVRIGNFLFVSGQIGIDQETGEMRDESIEAETRQVMENIMRILRTQNFDSSHVVSATVYLTNMRDYPRMNLIYGGYFEEGNYPARSTVEVSGLPKSANIEIAVIAYKHQ